MQPRNYLLFACHLTNATAQSVQDARFTNYWYFGGREKKLGLNQESEHSSSEATGKVIDAVVAARSEAKKTTKD